MCEYCPTAWGLDKPFSYKVCNVGKFSSHLGGMVDEINNETKNFI